ncbi:Ig-like domain-containing protein, partial [Euzebya rosea]|uniref:Ig-like domain-containing protein n=1 Tax=Euzebya rosea TaxID=2052804 RepID=UPI000DF11CB3
DGVAVVVGGQVRYTPAGGFVGTDAFDYRICDADGTCASARVTVTVVLPDAPPVANSDTATTLRAVPVDIDVLANDTDANGDIDVASLTVDPAPNGTTSVVGGQVRYTSSASFVGVDLFDYTICDDAGACDTASVQVTVDPTGTAPTANDDTASTVEDTPVLVDVLANDTDPDGDIDDTTLAVSSPPSDGVAVVVGGQVRYTPAGGFVGTDAFDYRICDADGTCDTGTVTLDVTPAASPPNAVDDTAATMRNTSVLIDVLANDSDPNGDLDPNSLSAADGTNGATTIVGGQVSYDPTSGFTGTDQFDYTVCDLLGDCSTATVQVTVAPNGSSPPTAVDDDGGTIQRGTVDHPVPVLANDTDPDGDLDAATLAIVSPPSTGAASVSGSTILWTPSDTTPRGPTTMTYRVCDTAALCDTATVTIVVVEDLGAAAVVANDDTATVVQGIKAPISVLANDLAPGLPFEYSTLVPTDGTNGTTRRVGSRVEYTSVPTYTGPDSFTYTVCDENGWCDSATVDVTVVAGDPVVAVDDAEGATTGVPHTVVVTSNDNDPDGSLTLATVTIVSPPSSGRATTVVQPNRSVLYTAQGGWVGVDTFRYRVCDVQGFCDSATVTMTVVADGGLVVEGGAAAVEPTADPVAGRPTPEHDPMGRPSPVPTGSDPSASDEPLVDPDAVAIAATDPPSPPTDAESTAPGPGPDGGPATAEDAPVDASPTDAREPAVDVVDPPPAMPARRQDGRVTGRHTRGRRRQAPGRPGPSDDPIPD